VFDSAKKTYKDHPQKSNPYFAVSSSPAIRFSSAVGNQNMLQLGANHNSNAGCSEKSTALLHTILQERFKQHFLPDSEQNSGYGKDEIAPTTTINGLPVNDDRKLEQEADVMGERAAESDSETTQIEPEPKISKLPEKLKAGIERLSGAKLDNIEVHHDSEKPGQIGALAYAKGSDIYLAPGQEDTLPHEAWHAAQQKQGIVKPTDIVKGKSENSGDKLETKTNTITGCNNRLNSGGNNSTDNYKVIQCTKGKKAISTAKKSRGIHKDGIKESMLKKIIRGFKRRKFNIPQKEVLQKMADDVENGYKPLIPGHNAQIIKTKNGIIRLVQAHPHGSGTMGRVVNQQTPEDQIMLTPGPIPWVGKSERIKVVDFSHPTSRRPPLGKLMGGSAAERSQIPNSEYLHKQGRQIGGKDTKDNLVAGSHALNTAMIPIENMIRDLYAENRMVSYTPKIFSNELNSGMDYARVLELKVVANGKTGQVKHTFYLREQGSINGNQYITKKNYKKIKADVAKFKASL